MTNHEQSGGDRHEAEAATTNIYSLLLHDVIKRKAAERGYSDETVAKARSARLLEKGAVGQHLNILDITISRPEDNNSFVKIQNGVSRLDASPAGWRHDAPRVLAVLEDFPADESLEVAVIINYLTVDTTSSSLDYLGGLLDPQRLETMDLVRLEGPVVY